MTEYYWYYCKNKAQADVVFTRGNLSFYGYIKEPDYEVIERYDLRYFEFGSLAAVAHLLR